MCGSTIQYIRTIFCSFIKLMHMFGCVLVGEVGEPVCLGALVVDRAKHLRIASVPIPYGLNILN